MPRMRQPVVAQLSALWHAVRSNLARRTSAWFELPPEATGEGCLGGCVVPPFVAAIHRDSSPFARTPKLIPFPLHCFVPDSLAAARALHTWKSFAGSWCYRVHLLILRVGELFLRLPWLLHRSESSISYSLWSSSAYA